MISRRLFPSILLGLAVVPLSGAIALSTEAMPLVGRGAIAPKQANPPSLCPQPALSRLTRHRIAAGETLVSIAQRYNLIPATLMGMNPVLRGGAAPVGAEIVIPPYNGIRVEVPAGRTWQELAQTYGVRADVLFEINGCQNQPRTAFIPGVNWSPNLPGGGAVAASPPAAVTRTVSQYPLPAPAPVVVGYGWQIEAASGNVVFHSGVDLAAAEGTPVLAAAEGTVAFAEAQGAYGNLVVINHPQGLQTRYAQLSRIDVRVGQQVRRGDRLGSVGATGDANRPHLHFEVRSNSDLGWVAEDPGNYFETMQFRGAQ